MKLIRPAYYDSFSCIASACRDNCCRGGWQIDVDNDTAERYMSMEGELGERLRSSLLGNSEEGYYFELTEGCCPFLDGSGLCSVYMQAGADYIGTVCTQFPRFSEYYGVNKEIGIGLACEEAARIIFEPDSRCELVQSELDEEEYVDEEFDLRLYDILVKARTKMSELLRGGLAFEDKLSLLLVAASNMQQMININDYSRLSDCVEAIAVMPLNLMQDTFSDKELTKAHKQVWQAYLELESINDKWDIAANKAMRLSKYPARARNYFEEHSEQNMLRLAEYFLYRYFTKAAYDHDVLSKIKLLVCNCIIIRSLDMSGERDWFETIHIFSRQIEYLEDSVYELAESFMFDEIFNTDNLIKYMRSIKS